MEKTQPRSSLILFNTRREVLVELTDKGAKLTGGAVITNETPIECAYRELLEETGLNIRLSFLFENFNMGRRIFYFKGYLQNNHIINNKEGLNLTFMTLQDFYNCSRYLVDPCLKVLLNSCLNQCFLTRNKQL